MDKKEVAIRKGQEADLLLNGEAGSEAFDMVRERIIRRWEQAEDATTREAAHAELRALKQIREQLRTYIQDGLFEAEALRRAQ